MASEPDMGSVPSDATANGAIPTPQQLLAAAGTFSLLSNPARLHLAWLMTRRECDVGSLAAEVGLSIPTTSQHLGKLRLAGVATAHRAGRHTYYVVRDPHVLALLDQIFSHFAPDGTLAEDPAP